MNFKHSILIPAVTFFVFAFNSMQAQTVILINGQPTSVKLSGTEIKEILDTKLENYLSGFDVDTTRVQEVKQHIKYSDYIKVVYTDFDRSNEIKMVSKKAETVGEVSSPIVTSVQ